ncbi:MAG: 50S ribosomal protein L22 [Actinobacteria bacterium]|nr:50S ribosomal protein L22 [Actinomycetota bacterium]
MEAKAITRNIEIPATKVKYVVDLIKNKKVTDAVDLLSLTPRVAAVYVKKAIQSAAANATENFKMKEEDLFISKIYVTQGPTIKRFRPRARGKADRERKRSSHLFVWVSDGKTEEVKKIGSKSKS